jgi:hypothetical protein
MSHFLDSSSAPTPCNQVGPLVHMSGGVTEDPQPPGNSPLLATGREPQQTPQGEPV